MQYKGGNPVGTTQRMGLLLRISGVLGIFHCDLPGIYNKYSIVFRFIWTMSKYSKGPLEDLNTRQKISRWKELCCLQFCLELMQRNYEFIIKVVFQKKELHLKIHILIFFKFQSCFSLLQQNFLYLQFLSRLISFFLQFSSYIIQVWT